VFDHAEEAPGYVHGGRIGHDRGCPQG
jgi:hypothetical protein